MPGGNRTGPKGMGPRSGRAAGYCSGSGLPGYENPASGRGFGFGRGRGFSGGGWGQRNAFHATGVPGRMRFGGATGFPMSYSAPDAEVEKQALRNQADALRAEMDAIKKRLGELEAGGPTE